MSSADTRGGIGAYRFLLPLKKPLPVRGRWLKQREILMLQVCIGDGRTAWAEASPLPGLHRESMDEICAFLQDNWTCILEALVSGGSVTELTSIEKLPSLTIALSHLHDQLNTADGSVDTPSSLLFATGICCAPLRSLPELIQMLHGGRLQGCQTEFKIKVDHNNWSLQHSLLKELCHALSTMDNTRCTLRLDANGSFGMVEAGDLIELVDNPNVQFRWIEDPCPDAEKSLVFCQHSGISLALDELAEMCTRNELTVLLQQKCVSALIVKPSLQGSWTNTLELCRLAHRHGASCILSSVFEGPWGLRALARLAVKANLDLAQGLGTAGFYALETCREMDRVLYPAQAMEHPPLFWQYLKDWQLMGRVRGRGLVRTIGATSLSPEYRKTRRRKSAGIIALQLTKPANTKDDAQRIVEQLFTGNDVFPLNSRLPLENQRKLALSAGCQTLISPTDEFSLGQPNSPLSPSAALLIATGGSSGQSRIVRLEMCQLLANAAGANQCMPLGHQDRWLLSLPLYHVGGLGILFRCMLSGAEPVFSQGGDLLHALRTQEITHLSLVPGQLQHLLDAGAADVLRRCQAVLLGGAALAPTLRRRATAAGIALATTYGMSEAGSQLCTLRSEDAHKVGGFEFGGSGRVLPGRKLRITAGKIEIGGAVVTRESGTKKTLWMATGDFGRLTEWGTLSVDGRQLNRIVSGGENIQAEAVEAVLCAWPGVRDALVLPITDPRWGERPCALLKLAPQTQLKGLREFLKLHLGAYECPDHILRWPDIETAGVKTDRKSLMLWLAEQQQLDFPAALRAWD